MASAIIAEALHMVMGGREPVDTIHTLCLIRGLKNLNEVGDIPLTLPLTHLVAQTRMMPRKRFLGCKDFDFALSSKLNGVF